ARLSPGRLDRTRARTAACAADAGALQTARLRAQRGPGLGSDDRSRGCSRSRTARGRGRVHVDRSRARSRGSRRRARMLPPQADRKPKAAPCVNVVAVPATIASGASLSASVLTAFDARRRLVAPHAIANAARRAVTGAGSDQQGLGGDSVFVPRRTFS